MWEEGIRRGKTGSDCRGHRALNQGGHGGESTGELQDADNQAFSLWRLTEVFIFLYYIS